MMDPPRSVLENNCDNLSFRGNKAWNVCYVVCDSVSDWDQTLENIFAIEFTIYITVTVLLLQRGQSQGCVRCCLR